MFAGSSGWFLHVPCGPRRFNWIDWDRARKFWISVWSMFLCRPCGSAIVPMRVIWRFHPGPWISTVSFFVAMLLFKGLNKVVHSWPCLWKRNCEDRELASWHQSWHKVSCKPETSGRCLVEVWSIFCKCFANIFWCLPRLGRVLLKVGQCFVEVLWFLKFGRFLVHSSWALNYCADFWSILLEPWTIAPTCSWTLNLYAIFASTLYSELVLQLVALFFASCFGAFNFCAML